MTNVCYRLSSPNSPASQNVDRETPEKSTHESVAVGFEIAELSVAHRMLSLTLFCVDVERKGTERTSYRNAGWQIAFATNNAIVEYVSWPTAGSNTHP
jgi:hypothetical protein